MKLWLRNFKRDHSKWYWYDGPQEWRLQFTRFGREMATVYYNGVWHTWRRDGSGGENSRELSITKAKCEAYHSACKQGFL
jgi:hypothetical protein